MQGVNPSLQGMEQMNNQFANIALHPQSGNVPTAASQAQNAISVEKNLPHLEQWLFTKWQGHNPPLWCISNRSRDPVDRSDIQAVLRKQKAKSVTAEQQLNLPAMRGKKKEQAMRLIYDRNASDPNPHFEWIIKSIRLDMEPKRNAAKAMRIILERRVTEVPRAVRQPIQPCASIAVVDMGPDPAPDRNSRAPQQGTTAAYNRVPDSMNPNGLSQQRYGQPDPQNSQPSQAWTGKVANPAAHAAFFEAQQRQAAFNQEQYRRHGGLRNSIQVEQDKATPKGGKRTPDIVAIDSDKQDSTSASEDNSMSDLSDCDTEITTPSCRSRRPTDYATAVKEAAKERRKSSTYRHSRDRSRRNSVTVRQHRRQSHRETSPFSSGSESDSFSDGAEVHCNRSSGRRQTQPLKNKDSHHSKKRRGSPEIRQHERPRGRGVSPDDCSTRYSDEYCDILPQKGMGTCRRGSVHSRASSYGLERPSFGHRRLMSSDSRYSFGLAEKGRAPVLGLEQGDRRRNHRISIYGDDGPCYLDWKERELRKEHGHVCAEIDRARARGYERGRYY